jgi:hypothetical protein
MAVQNTKSTQDFIPIKEIRDGVVIMKDGSMRSVLMVSSTNFALKSSDEQNSIIFQFQNFLNSLNFSVQICIQSRRLDIRPYVSLLENRMKEQTNDLMKIQMREYIKFIKTFTDENNIMKKTFFAVVSYTTSGISVGKSGISFFGSSSKKDTTEEKKQSFEEHRTQLDQRVSVVAQGLTRCGLRSVSLGTEELIEMYYKLFNPGDVEKPIPVING